MRFRDRTEYGANLLRDILASPAPVTPGRDGWDLAGIALALGAGAWLFAYKMRSFLGLGTTGDMYSFVQCSTSWLHGDFLRDNCWGKVLSIHAYLFVPVLAIFSRPFGAPGLLFALSLAASSMFAAIVRVLRLLAVPGPAAIVFALVATAMPLSLHLYQDEVSGFHVELLVPAMALWLFYFLLRRSMAGAVAMALVLLSVKEDSTVLTCLVGAVAFVETAIREFDGGSYRDREAVERWCNKPALVVMLMGALALPLLLHVIKAASPAGFIGFSVFRRLRLENGQEVHDGGQLFHFVILHLGAMAGSPQATRWMALVIPATFGLACLRPHLVPLGLFSVLISWLMNDDLLWPPRFAAALTFFLLISMVGFASLFHTLMSRVGLKPWRTIVLTALIPLTAWIVAEVYTAQLAAVPTAERVYALAPYLRFSPAERAEADRLFSVYRRRSLRSDPVIASDFLFRYAHDRNLYWVGKLGGRPKPIWILWDDGDRNIKDAGVPLSEYQLRAREGRFSLYHRIP
jgi:hypothetical protein